MTNLCSQTIKSLVIFMPHHQSASHSFPRHKQNPMTCLFCFGNNLVLETRVIRRVSGIRATKLCSQYISAINSIPLYIYIRLYLPSNYFLRQTSAMKSKDFFLSKILSGLWPMKPNFVWPVEHWKFYFKENFMLTDCKETAELKSKHSLKHLEYFFNI